MSQLRSTRNSPGFVTIVSGLPRSGTSMMMNMLHAGGLPVLVDDVRRPDEDNPGGYYEFEPVKQTRHDHSWLCDALGKAVKMVYRLLYDLPAGYNYRVVFMQRRLEEVLASQRRMLERNNKKEDAAVDDTQMATLFQSQLRQFKEWVPLQPNFLLLDVSYNGLLDEPSSCLAEVNGFLGGGLDMAAMQHVIDRSLYRNRC